jgi:hypothetical protein
MILAYRDKKVVGVFVPFSCAAKSLPQAFQLDQELAQCDATGFLAELVRLSSRLPK